MDLKIIPYVTVDVKETSFENFRLNDIAPLSLPSSWPTYRVTDLNDEHIELICRIAIEDAEFEPGILVPGGFTFFDGSKFLFADRNFSSSKEWMPTLKKAEEEESVSMALSNDDVYDIEMTDGNVLLKKRCGNLPNIILNYEMLRQALKVAYSDYEIFKARLMSCFEKIMGNKFSFDAIARNL